MIVQAGFVVSVIYFFTLPVFGQDGVHQKEIIFKSGKSEITLQDQVIFNNPILYTLSVKKGQHLKIQHAGEKVFLCLPTAKGHDWDCKESTSLQSVKIAKSGKYRINIYTTEIGSRPFQLSVNLH